MVSGEDRVSCKAFRLRRMNEVPVTKVTPHRGAAARSMALWLAALLLLLNGCALTFGYRHADWMIRWQLDHYLDLTSSQRRDVTARLKPLLSRHRAEALPQYEQFLTHLQERVSRGLTQEDLEWMYRSYDRFRADLFERLVPDSSALLMSVSEKQVRYLEKVFHKEEAKAAPKLQEPVSKRLEERTRKILAKAEDWLGPLSSEQIARIRPFTFLIPDTQPVWGDYRRQRQEELLMLLREPLPADVMSRNLRQMFVDSDQTASAKYREMVTEWRASVGTLVLETDRMLTAPQRRRAMASIQTVIDDLRTLIRGS